VLPFLIIMSFLCLNLCLTSIHRDISTNEKWQLFGVTFVQSDQSLLSRSMTSATLPRPTELVLDHPHCVAIYVCCDAKMECQKASDTLYRRLMGGQGAVMGENYSCLCSSFDLDDVSADLTANVHMYRGNTEIMVSSGFSGVTICRE
jgi:hypothetical protein